MRADLGSPSRNLRRLALLTALGGALAAGSASAQEESDRTVPVELPRLTGPIDLDGVIDEPAWEAVEPLPLIMYSPTFRGEMTERTELRVAYDDQYFYVSGRMYDSDPAGIRANTFNRDSFSGVRNPSRFRGRRLRDDQLAIVLDSYNDFETAVSFVVNPNGARSDRAIWADAEFTGGTRPFNSDWNAHWDAAARRTDEG